MDLEKNQRLLFMGDSITDCGRDYKAKPAGWSSWGDGYVNLINGYTTAFYPELELMVVNRGISGDRVTDLKSRWETNVLEFQPDWVTVMIGINDVWRHFDGTFCQDQQVSIECFEQTYRELIECTLPNVKGMTLLSNFMVEANLNDKMRMMSDEYRQVTKRLAEEYQLHYGDVQVEVDKFLEHQSSYVLSSDRVHVSLAGHFIIANTWLKAIELGGVSNGCNDN